MTIPPPLPVQPKLPQSSAWTAVRIVVQLVLLVPGLVILPFILVGVGIPGIIEAARGNPLAATPAAMATLFALGLALIAASVFIRVRVRSRAVLLPLVGITLFVASAVVLSTKFQGPGGTRQAKEIAGLFSGSVIVAAWNALRSFRALKNHTNVA